MIACSREEQLPYAFVTKKGKLGWPLVLGICESFNIPRPYVTWDGNNMSNLNKWERANRDCSRARHWTRRKNVGSLGQRHSNVEARTDMWPTNPLRKWLPVAPTIWGIALQLLLGVDKSHKHGFVHHLGLVKLPSPIQVVVWGSNNLRYDDYKTTTLGWLEGSRWLWCVWGFCFHINCLACQGCVEFALLSVAWCRGLQKSWEECVIVITSHATLTHHSSNALPYCSRGVQFCVLIHEDDFHMILLLFFSL